MRAYELMIIVDGESDDAVVQQILDLTAQLVTAGGGEIRKTDRWGKRPFAYEINHKWEGIYVVLEIATEATNLEDLERALRIADEVVRHKLIRLPDGEAAKRGLLGAAVPDPAG